MQLGLTATITLAAIQYFIDVRCFPTALIFVEARTATKTASSFNLWWFRVETTVSHLCYWVVLLTTVTLYEVKVGPDLPVDLLPAYSESFTDESHELLKVPVPIDDMLGSHLTVSIY